MVIVTAIEAPEHFHGRLMCASGTFGLVRGGKRMQDQHQARACMALNPPLQGILPVEIPFMGTAETGGDDWIGGFETTVG